MVYLGFLNSLHTESAFLHDSAHTNANVRVFLHLVQFVDARRSQRAFIKMTFLTFIVIKKIEAANFIWAVVGTVTCANTSIVSHCVQALFILDGCINWANRLTGSLIALLAHHAMKAYLYIIWDLHLIRFPIFSVSIVGKISVNSHPMHFPSTKNLILAHNRNVVFTLTGDYAGVTANTSVKINNHAPLLMIGLCNFIIVWIIIEEAISGCSSGN